MPQKMLGKRGQAGGNCAFACTTRTGYKGTAPSAGFVNINSGGGVILSGNNLG